MTMKQARVGANMTQAETAARMGVSVATYNKYEAAPHKMKIKDAVAFCRAVGVSLDVVDFVQDNDIFF